MYKYNEITAVHFEISSRCQAKCPMCARNHHGGLPNPLLNESDISLLMYKHIMSPALLRQIQEISMCGNFGDPIMNNDLIDMILYSVKHNPDILMQIHSNAGARTEKWWIELAEALPTNHVLHFGIDGLEDTHSIYRIGTDFNKIIKNAKAFINAGGKARWNFITFKHNEHQLDAARQMARELGFESFHEKQTSRFIGTHNFNVYDKNGNTVYKLEEPSERKVIFIDKKTVDNYKELVKTAVIDCEVERFKSIFVDAKGYLWPCCFTAGVPYSYSATEQTLYGYKNAARDSLNKVLDAFGGISELDLQKKTMQELVDSEVWQTVWDDNFHGDNKLHVCARTCGKFKEPIISQCRDQFLDLENF